MFMNLLKGIIIGILLTLQATIASAQLEITFPSSRAVFQRNNGNATIVYITGHYTQSVDRIDARFIPLDGGNDTGWQTIENSPRFGNFRGSIVVSGGWYKLEVRGVKNGTPQYFSEVDKVGVGEVFLISGQSNAQGYNFYGQPRANDDRVSVVTNFYSLNGSKPEYPTFGHLEAESKIAPTGNGAWCWGHLGDMLTSRLNVPVLFLNAAWEGFEVEQFYNSARGQAGRNPYSGNIAPQGYPYSSISDALHYYINMLGIRAVLWHQGESDNFLRTSSDEYRRKLQDVIYQSRNSSGKNISWVVARASKDRNGYWQPVIDGQNAVIQSTPNVFYGPNTDQIGDRWDEVHFAGNGLIQLAEYWNSSLDQSFFAYSNPGTGNPPLYLQNYCDPSRDVNNPLLVSAPLGYTGYEWSNGSRDRTAWIGRGRHQGKAFDGNGNVYFSAPITVPNDIVPSKPSVFAEGPTQFCQGESVNLVANGEGTIYWNNNMSGNRVRVAQAGDYTATSVNIYSCGNESTPIQVNNLPTPQPQIIASGPTDICSNETLELSSNLPSGIQWNNGFTGANLTVSEGGNYQLTATNEFGCTGFSNQINVTIREAAQTPLVSNMGKSEFCKTDSTELIASNFERLTWSNGLSNQARLTVKTGGTYYAINENDEGCKSKSEKFLIKVNPRPEKPTIQADGPVVFCDNSQVTLTAPDAMKYSWSNGGLSKQVNVNQTSEVFLRVENEFACVSPISDPIQVRALSTPKDPRVIQTGTFTLSASFSSSAEDLNFQWTVNDESFEIDKPYIKARKAGSYTVKGFRTYELANGSSLTCESLVSDAMLYVIDESKNGFSVYPNPSIDDILKIETLEDVDNAKISLYNLAGHLVRTYEVPVFDSVKTFDLSGIPKGNYIVKVKNNRSNFTSKLIIR